uniref:Uncharacterized protein n=1 Tax=Ciona intestinalis TaxID=7719 RepID=H2XNF9_CIOIN
MCRTMGVPYMVAYRGCRTIGAENKNDTAKIKSAWAARGVQFKR